jgi:hypothetical protein
VRVDVKDGVDVFYVEPTEPVRANRVVYEDDGWHQCVTCGDVYAATDWA